MNVRILIGPCTYWDAGQGHCGNPKAVPFSVGPRCAAHTPAALAGRDETVPPEPAKHRPALAAVPDQPWPPGEIGPCAKCWTPCHRYGRGDGPLCARCRAEKRASRKKAAA